MPKTCPINIKLTSNLSHHIFQNGGITEIFNLTGSSFQTPSLFAAVTIKVYLPADKLV